MWTHALVATLGLVTAGVLFQVGRLSLRRVPRGPGRLAVQWFTAFWFAGSAAIGIQATHSVLALGGILDPGLHMALLVIGAIPLTIAPMGLVYYLAYLYTGRTGLLVPLVFAYSAFFAFTMFVYVTQAPWNVVVTSWDVQLVAARPRMALVQTLGAMMALPVLGSTLAYASLLPRVPAGEPRWRVAFVSAAFVVLFGAIGLGFALGFPTQPWYPLTYEIPALAASFLFLMAYAPPRRIVRPVASPSPEGA
jgi:hypothetical protein